MVKYIFSISTGRSGSHFLSKLFEHVDSCVSLHEPIPILYGKPMRDYLAGKPALLKSLMHQKVEVIKEAKGLLDLYVETNHMFIKGFGWEITQYIPEEEIGVIILNRDPKAIVDSHIRIEATPLHYKGYNWTITPLVEKNFADYPSDLKYAKIKWKLYNLLLRTIYRKSFMELFGKKETYRPDFIKSYEEKVLYWYVEEIRKRAIAFKERFPRMKYYECSIDDLNKPETIENIFDEFGIEHTGYY